MRFVPRGTIDVEDAIELLTRLALGPSGTINLPDAFKQLAIESGGSAYHRLASALWSEAPSHRLRYEAYHEVAGSLAKLIHGLRSRLVGGAGRPPRRALLVSVGRADSSLVSLWRTLQ